MRYVLAYYRKVFEHAFAATWQSAGFWTLVAVPLSFFVGWGCHVYLAKFPQWKAVLGEPMAEWWTNILYLIAPMGLLAIIAALYNLILAPPRIDFAERSKLNSIDIQLQECKKHFETTRIAQFVLETVDFVFGISTGGSAVTVEVRLSNLGAPSIARDWRLLVTCPDGTEFRTDDFPILQELKLWQNEANSPFLLDRGSSANPPAVISPSMSLRAKTLERPIPTGGMSVGVLVFFIAGCSRDLLTSRGTVLRISCTDVWGREFWKDKLIDADLPRLQSN